MTEKNETETDKLDRASAAISDETKEVLRKLYAEVRRLRADAIDPLYKAALADRARLSAEVERLQSVVADQALTIGVLKDENAAIRKSIGDGDYGPTAAELQRFRDREPEVTRLRAELAETKHLLAEERALTAACAGKVST